MKLTTRNIKLIISLIILYLPIFGIAQDRIFSIGYTQNFVSKDSSNISFTVDLNRIPGKSEAGGGYFIVNAPLEQTKYNIFLKPTADINIGSYTTLAANNISIGLPFGFSRKINPDNPNSTSGVLWGSLELGPDFIADKTFDNYLYYFSPGLSLNYSHSSKKETIIEIGLGFKYGFGERLQSVETEQKNSYTKYIIPLGVAINLLKSKDDSFHHIKFSGIYKYNYILKDASIFTKKSNIYSQLKLDYYFVSQFGINITYSAGYEEPLFKEVNSIAFGITFARKG
jgi:hypothetical protein